MRLPLAAALAAVLPLAVAAQTVPAKGDPLTFEVASWNVEFFGEPSLGPPDAVQLSNVAAVIGQAEIDLWALQEVVDRTEWSDLLSQLQTAGYAGRLGPQVSNDSRFDQKLAFIYDPSVVQVVGTRTILDEFAYEFAGRLPFEMQARVTIGGDARTIYVVTFHAKASTGSEDYTRRAGGAAALKEYIDGRVARGEEVILLGDFNDYLTRSTLSNRASPYASFVSDTTYTAATLPIEQAGRPTYCTNAACTSGSARDHLLFTRGLTDAYVAGSGDRFYELISAVPSYTSSTSDHLPVFARFAPRATADEDGPEAGPVALLPAAPSPFRTETALRFRLDAPADVRLDVVDVLGRRVASVAGSFGTGAHTVPLDGAGLAPGLYVVRLDADGIQRTQTVVRAQ